MDNFSQDFGVRQIAASFGRHAIVSTARCADFFETMIIGGSHDGETFRHNSEKAARIAHANIVARLAWRMEPTE